MKFILASKSPRRKELLTKIGLKFKVVDSKIDESIIEYIVYHFVIYVIICIICNIISLYVI